MTVYPNVKKHMAFLEKQLETSGGGFLTGADLTAADIMMSYPLLAGKAGFDGMGKFAKGTAKESFPKVYECKFETRQRICNPTHPPRARLLTPDRHGQTRSPGRMEEGC
jgi:glutathione S-transferase